MLFLTVFCVLFRVNRSVSRHFSGVFLRGFRTQFNKTKYYKGRTSGSKEWLAGRDISLFHQHILHGARPCCQLPALLGRKIYAKTIDFIYRGKRNFDDHPPVLWNGRHKTSPQQRNPSCKIRWHRKDTWGWSFLMLENYCFFLFNNSSWLLSKLC